MTTAFQRNAFQNNAYQIESIKTGSTARAGGGNTYKQKPDIEIKQPEKEQPKKEVKKDIVVEIIGNSIKIELGNIEILTTSNTEFKLVPMLLSIEMNNIEIETSKDYYDENEYFKFILLLAA
jgi:hypothetical protein